MAKSTIGSKLAEAAISRQGIDSSPSVNRTNPFITQPENESSTSDIEPFGEASGREDDFVEPTLPSLEIAADSKSNTEKDKVYSNEDLLPYVDSIFHNGYAIDRYVFRNIEVVFKTRFTWEEQKIAKALDEANLNSLMVYQRAYSLQLLATSLAKYGEHTFPVINSGKPEELQSSYTERVEFVQSLNSVVTDVLLSKLKDFDTKQAQIVSRWDSLITDF